MHGLTDAGYRTHGIGKCHFFPDMTALRGFESREYEEGEHESDYTKFLKQNWDYKHLDNPYGTGSEMYYIPQPSTLPKVEIRSDTQIRNKKPEYQPYFERQIEEDTNFNNPTNFSGH